jgi:hypothetical protein
MKKLLAIALGVALLGIIGVQAEEKKEGEKHEMTAEQKKLKKEMTAKYDANKDGKLDKEERAKMSEEDKKKCKDAGLSGGHDHKDGEKKKEKKK